MNSTKPQPRNSHTMNFDDSTTPAELVGVLMINFGEPEDPTPEQVEPYLQRIFLQNGNLEGHADEAAVKRAGELARRRAPGLIEEYEEIGGSPLNAQADAQVAAVERELTERGWNVRCYSAFQFMDPSIADRLAEAREDGVQKLVVLPIYPICGQSTTVAALRTVERTLDDMDWSPDWASVSGWHDHPDYEGFRARHIAEYVEAHGLDLEADDTILYFSVHGTPVKYLDEGNRYDRYVEEHTRKIAARLGVERYAVGFQNHTNRGVVWTQPDNEDRIMELQERKLVVMPLAFMHEQSETLAELDHELREFTEEQGKEFHRVPVPHDDGRFVAFLADLAGEVRRAAGSDEHGLAPCRCHPSARSFCTNGARDLPPSPYVPQPQEQPA